MTFLNWRLKDQMRRHTFADKSLYKTVIIYEWIYSTENLKSPESSSIWPEVEYRRYSVRRISHSALFLAVSTCACTQICAKPRTKHRVISGLLVAPPRSSPNLISVAAPLGEKASRKRQDIPVLYHSSANTHCGEIWIITYFWNKHSLCLKQ